MCWLRIAVSHLSVETLSRFMRHFTYCHDHFLVAFHLICGSGLACAQQLANTAGMKKI
jgi:hypothetical protein